MPFEARLFEHVLLDMFSSTCRRGHVLRRAASVRDPASGSASLAVPPVAASPTCPDELQEGPARPSLATCRPASTGSPVAAPLTALLEPWRHAGGPGRPSLADRPLDARRVAHRRARRAPDRSPGGPSEGRPAPAVHRSDSTSASPQSPSEAHDRRSGTHEAGRAAVGDAGRRPSAGRCARPSRVHPRGLSAGPRPRPRARRPRQFASPARPRTGSRKAPTLL